MTQPVPPGIGSTPGQKPAAAAPVDEFELMRRRLKARGAATGEGQQRQLTRQFASLGNLPSGSAFKIRQQAQEAQERGTSEALQDVNILETQTRRAQEESAAQRGLQRELGQLGARTQLQTAGLGARTQLEAARIGQETSLGTARIGAESAQQVERLRGKFGLEEQRIAVEAAKTNLATQLASDKELMNLDITSKELLAGLDNTARMAELKVSDATARHISQMSLNNQLVIAGADRELRAQGLDLSLIHI